MHMRVLPGPAGRTPAVLVPGLGVSGRYFLPLARLLALRRRVLVPDLPGFGRSERPPYALGVGQFAAALGAWLDAVGVGRAHLVGNSLGCQILAELAAERPGIAASAVMVGPTGDPRAPTAAHVALRGLLTGPGEPPRLLAIVTSEYLRAGPLRTLQTLRRSLEHRLEPRVSVLDVPLLVLRGEHDLIAPAAWCERLAALAPHGSTGTLAGQWHAAHYSAPAAVAALAEPVMGAAD